MKKSLEKADVHSNKLEGEKRENNKIMNLSTASSCEVKSANASPGIGGRRTLENFNQGSEFKKKKKNMKR